MTNIAKVIAKMATGEFDLIGQYFTNEVVQRSDVIKGIGDDCAILDVPDGKQLVVTTDTMVSGIHFLGRCGCERYCTQISGCEHE